MANPKPKWMVQAALVLSLAPGSLGAQLTQRASSLEEGVGLLAGKLSERYAPLKTGMLDRLAVLTFDEVGQETKAKELGRVVSDLVGSRLVSNHGVKLVERGRLEELKREVVLTNTSDFNPDTAQKIGSFLGAQALVMGAVAEAGADYIVSARLVDVKTGQVLLAADVVVAREGLIALAEDAVEKKSRSGAIFRALIPGWGQFYNGPEHHWKGYTTSFGCLSAVATAVSMFVLAWQKDQQVMEWDSAENPALCAAGGSDPALCLQMQRDLQSEADLFRYVAWGAVGLFGALYVWSIIDAAIYGRDYEGIRISLSPSLNPRGPTPLGLQGTLSLRW